MNLKVFNILLILYLTCINFSLYSQSVYRCYVNRHYNFWFFDDNTYLITSKSDIGEKGCLDFDSLSFGSYKKDFFNYYLTSSSKINIDSLTFKVKEFEDTKLKDSVLIIINSPYESKVFSKNDELEFYKNPKIYSYFIELKIEENGIPIKNINIITKDNPIKFFIGKNVIVKMLTILIDKTSSCHYSRIPQLSYSYIMKKNTTNKIVIEIKDFDYFYFMYQRFNNHKVKRIFNGIEFNNLKLKRYKFTKLYN